MPSITVHPKPLPAPTPINPLPQLLRTPSGLALLELQGSFNTPASSSSIVPIGNLVFPLYSPSTPADDTAWMKKVYLYVGKHQRLTGEVKKLPKPIAIVRKRIDHNAQDTQPGSEEMDIDEELGADKSEELEIAEIVKHKIVFSNRPEPVDQH